MDLITRAYAKKLASGIKSITVNSTNDGLYFETNSGTSFNVVLPGFHTHSNKDILDKFSFDNINNKLLYDGQPIIGDGGGIEIVDNYSMLPTKTDYALVFCVDDYTDASTTRKKGFYLYNKNSSSWQYCSSESGGSSELTQDITANIDVGNTKSGFVFTTGMTFDDYVQAVHVAYVNPKATFTFSNTNTLIEIGTSFDLTMNVSNIIKGTSDIDKVVFLDGNIELNSKIYNSSTSNYSHSVNGVNTNKTFKIRVYDNKNKYAEGTKTYTFINASYIGIVDTNSVDESIVTSLQKVLLNSNSYTYDNITMTNKRICFAYPKSLGDLISVKDANNFEVLGSFIKTYLTINGINYVVYVTNSTSSLNNGKLIFK